MRPEPRSWGVDEGYEDVTGTWRTAPDATLSGILEAMGAEPEASPPHATAVVVRAGEQRAVEGPAELVTEDGGSLRLERALPPDLPLGYHRLRRLDDGAETTVIVSPGHCLAPSDAPSWGWVAQLYAARSERSWGIGDLGDLGRLGAWAADMGAGFVMVSPLHAAAPTLPQQASPYFPSSRCYRNPLYLRVEDVPGHDRLDAELEELARAGRALNHDRRIDRDEVFRLKMDALGRLWAQFEEDPRFDAYREAQGQALEAYATYCVLAEEHGPAWRSGWPVPYRHPARPEVAELRRERADRVRFHQWLQWLLAEQLEAASVPVPLLHDLAVGVDPEGADAWMWQDCLALGVRVGAPPDEFNRQGQDWGLPPFDPWRLRASAYQPFIATIRAALRGAGGLRVDHVMGLFRLYWIPPGVGTGDGTYVRYPAAELLDVLALESHRAGAFVVGEDLGTVEAGTREELAARGVLSYRLLWFEEGPPSQYPEQALAAVTTHDLPTVAGVWTGSDVRRQRDVGLDPDEEAAAQLRHRLQELAGLADDAPVDDAVLGAYDALARAPSALVAATLDDALSVQERPNLPGTTDQWPNWSMALPVPLEQMEEDERPGRIAERLGRRDRFPS